MSDKVSDHVSPGVATGDDVQKIFEIARQNNYALPAVNVVSTSSINAVLEAAKKANSPVIIQFSSGGASFYAGKGISGGKLDDHRWAGCHRRRYLRSSSRTPDG